MADKQIVDRLRFLAAGQDDPQSMAISEAADEIERLTRKLSAQQAHIDRLMMEYCPDEITGVQLEEWEKHQIADNSARSLAEEAHTLGRRRSPKSHYAGSNPAERAISGSPWQNGDTWHCRCGCASTAELCDNCKRSRADEWGDVPPVIGPAPHE